MSQYSVKFEGWNTDESKVGSEYRFSPGFTVWLADKEVWRVRFRISPSIAGRAVQLSGVQGVDDATRLDVLARWAVLRLRSLVSSGEIGLLKSENGLPIFVATESDLSSIASIFTRKRCEYLVVNQGRDEFCGAASSDDGDAIGLIGVHRVAPTSHRVCNACNVPSSEHLCSSFHHPEVASEGTFGSWRRILESALCDSGRTEISNPGQCRAGGNECWRLAVDVGSTATDRSVNPVRLVEEIDFFDTLWQLRFKSTSLFRIRRLTDIAELNSVCATREDFIRHIGALTDIFNSFEVNEALIPKDDNVTASIGSLKKIEMVLKGRVDPELITQLESSFKVLSGLVLIRNGYQHSDANEKLVRGLSIFGLPCPPDDWIDAWNLVVNRVFESIRTLRTAVQNLP